MIVPRLLLIAPLCLLLPILDFGSQLDVQAIIERSVSANEKDYEAAPLYSYKERDREAGGSNTFEVDMLDGSPYRRLIAVNNKPLSAEENKQEQQKFDNAVAHRRAETPEGRRQRIQKYESDRKRDHELMQQLTTAFQFKLVGERKLGSFVVYLLKATPRQGYNPPNLQTRVLTGMEGQLWIDKDTYQWVKVTAKVIRPVSIEGFLAQVEPGTRFELEKMPVGNGIWQPKHFSMKALAKVLFFFNRNSQEDEIFFDYRKRP